MGVCSEYTEDSVYGTVELATESIAQTAPQRPRKYGSLGGVGVHHCLLKRSSACRTLQGSHVLLGGLAPEESVATNSLKLACAL